MRGPEPGMADRGGRNGRRSTSTQQAPASGAPIRRCGIYTRKSTEEGLDQDFNSLHAQREACEAYVASQRHEGWVVIGAAFDDGGYSGGTMDRPGLRALLAEVDAGGIDVVVVYKVDRLTRALADFARIVDRFDAQGVSFVSVTQSFNTTSSMGRLTLNVLLSFAQFEREVGAERVRDKIAASRKKGMWMGGTVPMGYRAEGKKLVIDRCEAATVRKIFALYLDCGSTPALLIRLRNEGIVTARRVSRGGRTSGGVAFGTGSISYLLHNPVYIGEAAHKGSVYPGEHAAIIDRVLFDAVQARLVAQQSGKARVHSATRALLMGRIFDSAGNRMTPSHANKGGVRYRYYVSRAIFEGRKAEAGDPARVPAIEIEEAAVKAMRQALTESHPRPAQDVGEMGPMDDLLTERLESVVVHPRHLVLTLKPSPECSTRPHAITIAWSPAHAKPHRHIVAAPSYANDEPSKPHRQLTIAIQTAHAWMHELETGKADSIEAIAAREGKHPRSIRSGLTLALLAPDILDRLIRKGLPAHVTLTDIGRSLPPLWADQRTMLV